MQQEFLTNLTQELEEWETSINNTIKECQINIDNVEKTCSEARLTAEQNIIGSFNQKKFQCKKCPFKSNWQ